jgi:hypothetical protein
LVSRKTERGRKAPDPARKEACMARVEQSFSSLVDLVKQYQVCWEVWPEVLMVGGKEKQVGFELELSGTPEPRTDDVGPGCSACRRVYDALLAVAHLIFPREERPRCMRLGHTSKHFAIRQYVAAVRT